MSTIYTPAGATTCATPLNVLKEVLVLKDEIIANRRWFHAHPELSFKEVVTAAKVAEHLKRRVDDQLCFLVADRGSGCYVLLTAARQDIYRRGLH